MRIYILSDYEEHGADNVVAAADVTDPERLWAAYVAQFTEANPPNPECYAAWMANAKAAFDAAMLKNELGCHELGRGWGGPVLEIVEAVDA